MAYLIEFAESIREHLSYLSARERVIVIQSIEEQLMYEPLIETRNRKPMRPNPLAPWELRIGALRIFYEVVSEEQDTVRILAIAKKEGNNLFIAGQEVKLNENA
ncbi:type II toxin-antitoxin system RelE/ParE family toxin [Aerosakkonemataceae cyanobacterium BLCC-F154]|uniref:Type II toxin-antitoxin system RelE/ParE family toxin n=1 Tax=Floridaenema fluviatile BLCC-F154 TaxID=3153640 RepID=A0ABV4YFL8_9CYAN